MLVGGAVLLAQHHAQEPDRRAVGTASRLAGSDRRRSHPARPADRQGRELEGVVLRTLANRAASTGHTAVAWDGRLAGGRRAPAGTYVVVVTATNQIGTADLTQSIRAR